MAFRKDRQSSLLKQKLAGPGHPNLAARSRIASIMGLVNRFWAIFVIATKRILSQPWMALATVIGMVFAISLTMSVPLYASSVYNRIFLQSVNKTSDAENPNNFPPFTFLFQYDTSTNGNLQWQDLDSINQFLKIKPTAS